MMAAAVLTACSWLQTSEQSDDLVLEQPRSLRQQDPHMRRFYELEQEIARLRASNQQLQQQVTAGTAQVAPLVRAAPSSRPAPLVSTEATTYPLVDDVLARIRLQADSAIAAIDRALGALGSSEEAQLAAEPATLPVRVPVLAASDASDSPAQRDNPPPVETVAPPPPRRQYNYSVVYVYAEPQPWHAMWEKLDTANEQDKWRGKSADQTRYFIYVGAYLHQPQAETRQQQLLTLVGERPDVRERAPDSALAAN